MRNIKSRSLAVATVAATLSMLLAPAAGAATHASYSTQVNSSPSTSITLSTPSGADGDDLLIAAVVIGDRACQEVDDDNDGNCVRINAPSGWTLINVTTDGTPVSMASYRAFASAVGGSSTWTFEKWQKGECIGFGIYRRCTESGFREAEVRALGGINRFRGVDIDSPVVTTSETDDEGKTIKAPSVTTDEDDRTVVALFADASTDAFSSSLTERYVIHRASSSRPLTLGSYTYAKEVAGATGEQTVTTSHKDQWVAQQIVLRDAVKNEPCLAPKEDEEEEEEIPQDFQPQVNQDVVFNLDQENPCDEEEEEEPRRGGGHTRPYAIVAVPNGGETYTQGTNTYVFWGAYGDDLEQVRVSLSTDSGATFPTEIVVQDWNTGTHDWLVPDINTTTARVRVEVLNGDGAVIAYDDSDADFTIVGTPAPEPTPEVLGDTTGSLPWEVGTFVKLPTDNNPDTQEDSTVYYVGEDDKLHPFVSQPAYHTWFADFGDVTIIDQETLDAQPMGDALLFRPGAWLKTVGDSTVYFVEAGNVLRAVTDEAVALQLGGDAWASHVYDTDADFLTKYAAGEAITADTLAAGFPNGYIGRDEEGTVWLVADGKRRKFATDEAFTANRYLTSYIHEGTTGWLTLEVGTEITGQENGLTSLLP